jgi:hypothetical protein
VARKSKYTPALIAEIASSIKEGNTQEDSARMAGIHVSTFYDYMKHSEFSEAVEKAHAEFKKANVLAIRAAGIRAKNGEVHGSWQANAWLLERKYPEEFGQRLTIRVTPEQAAILKKVGKSAGDAFEEFMQNLEAELKNG